MSDIATLWEFTLTDKLIFAAMKIHFTAAGYSRMKSNDTTETMFNIEMSVFDELGKIKNALIEAFQKRFYAYFATIFRHNQEFMTSSLEEMMRSFCNEQLDRIDQLIRRIVYYFEVYNRTKKVINRKICPWAIYIEITLLIIFNSRLNT